MKTRADHRRAKALVHLRLQMRRLADEKAQALVRSRIALEAEHESAMRRVQELAGADALPWLRRGERLAHEIAMLAAEIEGARQAASAAARAEKLARDWCDEMGRDVEAREERRALEELAERAATRGDASLG